MTADRSNLAPSGPHSRIYRDPEVRASIDGLSHHPFTIDEIQTKLVERFGTGRTPSRSAIGRYVRRMRLILGINFLWIDPAGTLDQ